MIMKKIIELLLVFSMALATVTGCGQSSSGSYSADDDENNDNEKGGSEAYNCGKKAYKELCTATELCLNIGNSVYEAGYIAIYEAEYYAYYGTEFLFTTLGERFGLTYDELEKAAEELEMSLEDFPLSDIYCTVGLVVTAFELNGKFGQIDTSLANAKAELKTMTDKYNDYEHLQTLRSFFAEVKLYADLVNESDGELEKFLSEKDTYEKNLKTFISDLSFVFEDDETAETEETEETETAIETEETPDESREPSHFR